MPITTGSSIARSRRSAQLYRNAMVKLKDVYPLYLANEAKQPNTDLEVTDKYSGEVAFRVAMADAATIDAGIAAAVAAAEPMARMASYERQAVLQHCVDRFRA